MSFGILFLVVAAGLAGPLLGAGRKLVAPVVVGELVAGLVLGRTGFRRVLPDEPTTAFLAQIGFAMLMFTAGMHVPLRHAPLVARVRRGAVAAGVAALLAVGAGWLTARLSGHDHPWVFAVILASGSAAILLPALDELDLLVDDAALVVAAQVAIADVAAIVAVPLVLQPSHAARAGAGIVVVAAAACVLAVARRPLSGTAWVHRIRRLSKDREWALDLRLLLVVLFALCWVSVRLGSSVLVAGFAVGLVAATIGGPKRLSRQVTGIGQGFFVPFFFVVLGARIDLRALIRQPSLLGLAALLVGLDVAVHLLAALVTRQRLPAGLAATAQLGVPAAVVSLGLQLHVVSAGEGAAVLVAALATVGVSAAGCAGLARRSRAAAPARVDTPAPTAA